MKLQKKKKKNKMNNNRKLPLQRELFLFILLNCIHVMSYILVFKDLKFCILLTVELFYFFYLKNSVLKLFRFFYFTLIIFLLNLFFMEGEIIFKIGIFKITREGLINGSGKCVFLIGLLFTTNNVLQKNKNYFIAKLEEVNTKGLIIKSINYFFTFIDNIGNEKNIKSIINKVINIYGENEKELKIKELVSKISMDFYVYHFVFFIMVAVTFFIKI